VVVWLVYPKIQSVMGWQDSFLELIPIEIVVSLDAVVYLVMSQFLGVSRLGLCVRRRLFRLGQSTREISFTVSTAGCARSQALI
jgi:hypothetical protein